MRVGAVVALLLVVCAIAPARASAELQWDPTYGLWRWFDENGAATDRTMLPGQFNQLRDRLVAAGQEMYGGAAVPTDIATADAAAGVGAWDSLQTAGVALKSQAMDLIGAEGAWAGGTATFTFPTFALGAGVFYVGWQIGTQIDHLLGIDTGSGSQFQGGYQTTAASVTLVPSGYDLDGLANYCSGSPCISEHPLTSGASYVVRYNSSTGTTYDAHEIQDWSPDNHACDAQVANTPSGGSWVVTAITSLPEGTGCTNQIDQATDRTVGCTLCMYDEVYVIPAQTANVPGPGQGLPLGGDSQVVTTNYTGPNEDGKKRNASGALQNPNLNPGIIWFCSQNQDICGPDLPGNKGTVTIPPFSVGETFQQYDGDLQRAGVKGIVVNDALSDSAADPSKPPLSVVQVSPAPGSAVDPYSKVDVETNPRDLPDTPPGGGAPGAPSAPGINIPTAQTPCNVFPFGVPCWLLRQLNAFVATPEAPAFTVVLPHFGGNCTDGACDLNIDLSHAFGAPLSSVMDVVRPVLLVSSFVALVVWFAGMAMGGSTGGGGSEGKEE